MIVLTKPLGTQLAVNLNEWIHNSAKAVTRWERAKGAFFAEQVPNTRGRLSLDLQRSYPKRRPTKPSPKP